VIEEVTLIDVAPGTWVRVDAVGLEVRYEGDCVETFQLLSDGTIQLPTNTDDWLKRGRWYVRVIQP